jgi:hypothetical protein
MLFVGDSLHDGEIAEQEGVPFVAVASTFSPERFMLRFPQVPVLRRFAALPELFSSSSGTLGGSPNPPATDSARPSRATSTR